MLHAPSVIQASLLPLGEGQDEGFCPMGEAHPSAAMPARAYPLFMESKVDSKLSLYQASLPENRFALFRTHSKPSNPRKDRLEQRRFVVARKLYRDGKRARRAAQFRQHTRSAL